MLRGPVQWKRALPVAIIAALCAVPLAETLVGKDALYARDVSILFWSTRTYAARSLERGRLPGWDPRSQTGMPFLGNAPTGVLYPPTALFQVLPFPRAYAWFVYLHQVFGACGVFVLLRRLQLGRAASLAGALTFGLGGCVAGYVNAGPFMAGAAFVPWIVAALVSDGPGLRRAAMAALGIAAQVLAGDPQAVLYAVLAALILAACKVHREAILRPLALALPLAAALAAIQLLPAWGVLQESDRAEFAKGFVTAFALHPARLLELALPLPFGTPAGTPELWGGALVHGPGRWPFALSAYVGAAALAFAALAVGRDRVAVGGAAIFCCGLLLASGSYTPLGGWIFPLPPFRFFRYPEKYLVLSALGIAILVACGVERLGAGLLTRRRLAIASAAGLVAVAAMEVAFRSDAILAGFLGWLHASRVTAATARETLQTALAQAALGGGLALGLGWVSMLRPRLRPTLARLAPLVVAVDLLGPARAVALTGPSEIYSEPPLVEILRKSAPAGPW